MSVEAMKHRRADLLDRVNQTLCASALDAPAVLAAGLRARLDDDLAGMLDDIMGIYHERGNDNEEALMSVRYILAAAAKIEMELEGVE